MPDLQLQTAVVSRPGRLGGEPCFIGTRVPVQSLFDHLEEGYTVDEFLTSFPSVSREAAITVLHEARLRITTGAKIEIERVKPTGA
jgi:uncharacterized protein (DUF433 family)